MLKMVSKKVMLLLGVVMAVCTFVAPSMASAASWSPVGTTDGRIDTSQLGFSVPALSTGSSCESTSISVVVDSAAVATVTGASFANCHGNVGGAVGCTLTATGTNYPWRVTALTTSSIQIHGIDIDISYETTPGTLNECLNTGLNIRLTGTTAASFTPGAAGSRIVDFGGATGMVAHVPGLGTFPLATRGSGTVTGLLNVIM